MDVSISEVYRLYSDFHCCDTQILGKFMANFDFEITFIYIWNNLVIIKKKKKTVYDRKN